MVRKTNRELGDNALPPSLIVPVETLRSQLDAQLERGRSMLAPELMHNLSTERLELDEDRWTQFVKEILRRAFSTDQYEQEFARRGAFGTTHEDPHERLEVLRERMAIRINALESIRERLDLFDPTAPMTRETTAADDLSGLAACLHETVIERCGPLYQSKHYAEAVEKSFRLVRDRLRALTGHERGSDAFGKSKLHIKGAIAPHVDKDFNEGVKFLTMAIDMFRNEKSHTSEIGIDDPTKALQYLALSSLAMRLLDGAEMVP